MSDDNNTVVDSVDNNDNINNENRDDKVAYESYQKVLKEKKAIQARTQELENRLRAFEEAQAKAEEEKLKEQQKYKEIAERKENELKKLQEQISHERKKQVNKVKEEAFKKALGHDLKKAYLLHADLDSIDVTDSGEIDEMTLEDAVAKFKENYPELLPKIESKEDKKVLPQIRARGAGKTPLSAQDLKGLSFAELAQMLKEQRGK